jgi:hypothetical protein
MSYPLRRRQYASRDSQEEAVASLAPIMGRLTEALIQLDLITDRLTEALIQLDSIEVRLSKLEDAMKTTDRSFR